MLAIVCPGQGSQTPGFLSPWLELPHSRSLMQELSDYAKLDLLELGTTADANTIKDTANAQPLIVASGIMALDALFGHDRAAIDVLAGHSVGEITAAAAAGVITPEAAMKFVRERAQGMAGAAAVTATGMSAVVGGDQDEVVAHLDSLGLTPANMNGAGQIVAAGTHDQLEALKENPPAKARVIPLAVAGAFHTAHMAPAIEALQTFATSIAPSNPEITLLSNKDGAAVSNGTEILDRLVAQVSNPVRWDLTMDTLKAMGVTGIIEMPPAGALTGLAKRGLPGVETLAVKTPDDLEKARTMVAEHSNHTSGQVNS